MEFRVRAATLTVAGPLSDKQKEIIYYPATRDRWAPVGESSLGHRAERWVATSLVVEKRTTETRREIKKENCVEKKVTKMRKDEKPDDENALIEQDDRGAGGEAPPQLPLSRSLRGFPSLLPFLCSIYILVLILWEIGQFVHRHNIKA